MGLVGFNWCIFSIAGTLLQKNPGGDMKSSLNNKTKKVTQWLIYTLATSSLVIIYLLALMIFRI